MYWRVKTATSYRVAVLSLGRIYNGYTNTYNSNVVVNGCRVLFPN